MRRITGDLSPMLSDGEVSLRVAAAGDVDALVRWGADPEFARYHWASDPWFDPALAGRFLDHYLAMPPSQGRLFMIEAAGHGVIGYSNYRDVRPKVRSCEVGIAIGERSLWGHECTTRAMRLLLGYLFDAMGMHKVSLRVVAFHSEAIRAYQRCGFKREGLLHDAYLLDNRWWDSLLMAILEHEWAALAQRTA